MIDTAKLKAKMVESGVTQRDLAELTGYGLNHINEILNNKTSPRLDLVNKIRIVLDINDPQDLRNIFFAQSVPNTEQKIGDEE